MEGSRLVLERISNNLGSRTEWMAFKQIPALSQPPLRHLPHSFNLMSIATRRCKSPDCLNGILLVSLLSGFWPAIKLFTISRAFPAAPGRLFGCRDEGLQLIIPSKYSLHKNKMRWPERSAFERTLRPQTAAKNHILFFAGHRARGRNSDLLYSLAHNQFSSVILWSQ